MENEVIIEKKVCNQCKEENDIDMINKALGLCDDCIDLLKREITH